MDDNVGQHDFAVTVTAPERSDPERPGTGVDSCTRTGPPTTVRVHGDFDRNACVAFDQAVGDVDRSATVIVDIGESSTIDSSAIASLVRLHGEVLAAQGEFSVVITRPFQRRIFEITDLTAHLHVVDRTVEGQTPS